MKKLTIKQREYYAISSAKMVVSHLKTARNYFRLAMNFKSKKGEQIANGFLFDAQEERNDFLKIADMVTPRCKDYEKFQGFRNQMEQIFADFTADLIKLAKDYD